MSGQRSTPNRPDVVIDTGRCLVTGKRSFFSRRDARRALRAWVEADRDGLCVYLCPHCDRHHIGHHADRPRHDHRTYHTGGEADPTWLTVEEVTRRLKPARPAKMRAVLERMAAEGLIQAEGALGITLIHRDELPRLHRAAHDASQDDRLKGL